MATIDESGTVLPDRPEAAELPPSSDNVRNLGDARKKRTRKARGGMGGTTSGTLGANANDGRDTSLGARVWEFLHPGQVQDEYRAVGAEVPSQWDIMTQSAADAAAAFPDAVGAGVDNLEASTWNLGKLALIGVGIWVFLEVTADRRLKRYAED